MLDQIGLWVDIDRKCTHSYTFFVVVCKMGFLALLVRFNLSREQGAWEQEAGRGAGSREWDLLTYLDLL